MIQIVFVFLLFCNMSAANWDEAKIIQEVEGYFNNLDTLQSNFIQINPDKSEFEGMFYLKRPGKFRFDYSKPSNYLVVSNGKTLVTYDYDMDNPAYIPLSSLPVSVLFDKPMHIRNKTKVLHTMDKNDIISVKLSPKEDPDAGQILLVFSKQPFELKAWYIHNTDAGLTEVQLLNPKKDIKFKNEKDLFRFNVSAF